VVWVRGVPGCPRQGDLVVKLSGCVCIRWSAPSRESATPIAPDGSSAILRQGGENLCETGAGQKRGMFSEEFRLVESCEHSVRIPNQLDSASP